MLPLTRKELKSFIDADVCYICGIRFLKNLSKNINHPKFRDHCHWTGKYSGEAHSICNLKFNVSNEILIVFHNGSNYDYHFITKELPNEFELQFKCIDKFPIKKEIIKIDIDGNKSVETITYKKNYWQCKIYGKFIIKSWG